jgi:hypothetical protein
LIGGAPVWGVVSALPMLLHLWRQDRLSTFHLTELLVVFMAGGALAWLLAGICLSYLNGRLPFKIRLPLAIILLAAGTLCLTAFFFALDYRSFYAQWHAPALSMDWTLQFLFTSASAGFQFLVIGLPYYLPFGPLLVLVAAPVLLRAVR